MMFPFSQCFPLPRLSVLWLPKSPALHANVPPFWRAGGRVPSICVDRHLLACLPAPGAGGCPWVLPGIACSVLPGGRPSLLDSSASPLLFYDPVLLVDILKCQSARGCMGEAFPEQFYCINSLLHLKGMWEYSQFHRYILICVPLSLSLFILLFFWSVLSEGNKCC